MRNAELARVFERIADALELKGETGFRVLAYRRAGAALQDLAEDVAALVDQERLQTVPGIGEGIGRKVREYIETGRMKKYDEAVAGLPPDLFLMLDIPGVGPRTVRLLHQQLGITTLDGLRSALRDGSVARLPGMGPRKVERILRGMAATEQTAGRMWLDEAQDLAESVVAYLLQHPKVSRAVPAGSLRRGRDTVGDLDILVSGSGPSLIVQHFTGQPGVKRVLGAGETKASVLLETPKGTRQVDIRVVTPSAFGAALQYFTGCKEHNIALRALAQARALKLSEYGLFKNGRRVSGHVEDDIYAALGLAYVEPELRENRGEIDAAATGALPALVQASDIRADLHMHTDCSDGAASLEQMAEACHQRGYTHIAVTEHSPSAGYAGGLSADALERLCDRVETFNARSRKLKVLRASEVDVTPSGRLDYPDRVLARLDLVIASIHQAFDKNATERLCGAIENPLVHLIAHPSGRIIGKRPGYDIDLEQVIDCAVRRRKVLEINAYPGRLDLSDTWARRARDAGAKLAVNTDAHSTAELGWMRFGVITARRAWLEPKDIVNCMTYRGLLAFLKAVGRSAG